MRRSCRRENIRTQVGARHLVSRNVLDRWPVFSLDSYLVIDPIGNGLLTEGFAAEEASDAISKGLLAPSDDHGAFDGFSAHVSNIYKRACSVNKPAC